MYHYVQSEPGLWTVGHGEGKNWTSDSDHERREAAAKRVAYLNGGGKVDAKILSLLNEITDLASLSRMKPGEDALEKLTSIFMLSVKATVLLEL